MKNLFIYTTIFMIALNMFLFMTLRRERADFGATTNILSISLTSEKIAWKFVDNLIQFNDFELFNPEIKKFLDLKKDITPLLVINGMQCQPCIDELLKNLLILEDSLEIIPEIKFVFIIDSTENSNNVNFLGKYFQKTYIINEEQLTSEVERQHIPGVFLIMADYQGRIKSFCEFDVNYCKNFVNNLIKINEKYHKQLIGQSIIKIANSDIAE